MGTPVLDVTGAQSPHTERIISLLGLGITGEKVAEACGITPGLVSIIAASPEVSKKIAELRFKNLSKHNERDDRYGELEDKLLTQLEQSLVFLGTDPMKVAKVLTLINKTERRGAVAPNHLTQQSTVVNLTLPIQILQQFSGRPQIVKDVNNQVIQAGTQELITVQSSQMNKLLEAKNVVVQPAVAETVKTNV
jgi:tRNA threonylcarbamoyladenosine modification (KEOPS) complex Cgi121 subunit